MEFINFHEIRNSFTNHVSFNRRFALQPDYGQDLVFQILNSIFKRQAP